MRAPRSSRKTALLPVGGSLLAHGLAALVLGIGGWWLATPEEPSAPPEFEVVAREDRPDVEPVTETQFDVVPPEEPEPLIVEQEWEELEEFLPEAEVEMLLPHPPIPIDWDAVARDTARPPMPPNAVPVVETSEAETVPPPSEAATTVEAPQVDSLACPPPRYPRAARRQHQQGLVEVLVQVDATGQVAKVTLHVSSGHRLLDDAATKAVKNWGFHPARDAEGRACAGELVVPVRFRLSTNT